MESIISTSGKTAAYVTEYVVASVEEMNNIDLKDQSAGSTCIVANGDSTEIYILVQIDRNTQEWRKL